MFPVQGQTVNILGFAGYTDCFIYSTMLLEHNTDNKQAYHIPIKLVIEI